MRSFNTYLRQRENLWGRGFDATDLAHQFVPYYENGQRIKVDFGYEVVTGTVGVTTGWRPCFLLMRTRRSRGSSYLLHRDTKIVAVKVGRKYVPAE